MAENTSENLTGESGAEPRAHFAKAIEEARTGAQLAGQQAKDQALAYRDKLGETAATLGEDAKARSDDAIDAALQLANDGKTRASGAIHSLGKLVEDNAAVADERLGVQYGDYVRTAGRSLQDFAQTLDEKEFGELAEDVREFARARPAVAIGIAAAGGFLLSRMFKRSDR